MYVNDLSCDGGGNMSLKRGSVRPTLILLALLVGPTAGAAQEPPPPLEGVAAWAGVSTGPSVGRSGYRLWNVRGHAGMAGRVLLTGQFAAGSRLVLLCHGVDGPECDERAGYTSAAAGLQLVLGSGGALEPYMGGGVGTYVYNHPAGRTSGGILTGQAGLRYRFHPMWGAYAELSNTMGGGGMLPFFGAGVFLRSP